MLAVQPRKRPREPTPPPTPLDALDLPSPLDFFHKKRRKSEQAIPTSSLHHNIATTPDLSHPWNEGEYFTPSRLPGSAPTHLEVDAGVERRRSKAWERRNGDPLPPKFAAPTGAERATLETPLHPSSQVLPASSPMNGMVRAYSEPEASSSRHLMSSSPVRHQPFDSSPFRASTSSRTRVDPDGEVWDMAEVERTWGEEYTSANSLLYSLHRTRRETASQTPDNTFIQTPAASTTDSVPHPYPPHHTTPQAAYDYRDTYRETPPSSTHYTSSSPFPHTQPSSSAMMVQTPNEYDYDGMEMLQDHPVDQNQQQIQQRYEEANRLLGALEVERRQRWGEG